MDDSANDRNLTDEASPYNDPITGRFRPKNPGRPWGAKGRTKASIRNALHSRTDAALAALDSLIEKGSDKAVLFILERTIAPKGGRTVELHGTEPEDIEAALADGSLSLDEAASAARTLLALKGLREIQTLKEKLEFIERAIDDTDE